MENEVGTGFISAPRNAEAVVPHCVMPGDASALGTHLQGEPVALPRVLGVQDGGERWSRCSIIPALWRLPASLREKREFLLVCSVQIGPDPAALAQRGQLSWNHWTPAGGVGSIWGTVVVQP